MNALLRALLFMAVLSSVNFAAGDILEDAFPGTADLTLGDIAITVPAVRR